MKINGKELTQKELKKFYESELADYMHYIARHDGAYTGNYWDYDYRGGY